MSYNNTYQGNNQWNGNNRGGYPRNNNQNNDFHFSIVKHIAVLGQRDNGWTKEVNIVSWNGNQPKVDIREWDPNHERMRKGSAFTEEEAEKIAWILAERYGIVKSSSAGNFRAGNTTGSFSAGASAAPTHGNANEAAGASSYEYTDVSAASPSSEYLDPETSFTESDIPFESDEEREEAFA